MCIRDRCCVIAVLVIAACVLAYVRFGGQAGQNASQQQPQTQQQAPAASSKENEKPETKADDDAAKASAEALSLIHIYPGLRALYDRKRAEGKPHRVAVTAVARKLCHIVFAVMRDQVPYDPGRE